MTSIRKPDQRIFVNKPADFERIQAIGFDMDYTLVYYTPAYEALQFELIIKNLVEKYNYPADIKSIKYDPEFAVKGLFVDTFYGNILKIDFLGIVHKALHGKTELKQWEIRKIYKDASIPLHELEHSKRYYLQSTAFAAPICTLFAELVEYFEIL